ncbi:MAG: serine/threonine protein kinase [Myxococcales bacterium]|nr:serine/threonine protein kinase [Myxococcales bacterium]
MPDPKELPEAFSPDGEETTARGRAITKHLLIGQRLGNYLVEGFHHAGGFALVFKGRHVSMDRPVALKVLHHDFVAVPDVVRRFRLEADAINRVKHPGIVEIYDIDELPDRRPYLVMEWIEGRNLDRELLSRGAFSTPEIVALVSELGSALSAVHAAGIVHRALKASNIMAVPDGAWFKLKLVDFGLSKFLVPTSSPNAGRTAKGTVIGTPETMAPEQILGAPCDARTDIYAVGVLIYQLATGRLPFEATTLAEVQEMHLHTPPPRASLLAPVPPALDLVLARCLDKAKERRYPTVEDLVADLKKLTAPSSVKAERTGMGLYADLRVEGSSDDLTDADLDDLDRLSESVRGALSALGARLAIDAPNALLGVVLLPEQPEEARRARESALRAAVRLARTVSSRPGASKRLQLALSAHAGSLLIKEGDGQGKILGGDLMKVTSWATGSPSGAVCATREALDGLPFTPEPVESTRLFRLPADAEKE